MFYKFNCKSPKIEEIVSNKEIVMFGAGIISEYYVKKYNIDVKYFVDNNEQKWDTEFLGRKVFNPKYLNDDKDNIIIFIGSQYINEISQQLEKMNLLSDVNYYIPTYLEEKELSEKAGIYKKQNSSSKRILVDMSEVANEDLGTGIQRVVKNIVKVSYMQKKYCTVSVQRIGEAFYEPSNWLDRNQIKRNYTGYEINKIEFIKGDTLIILDSVWNEYARYKNILKEIKSVGGNIIGVIYDIIPLEYPEKCVNSVVNDYEKMLTNILKNGDGIIAISKTVADKLISIIDKNHIKVRKNFKIGWFHMGISKNDFSLSKVNSNIQKVMNKKPFIMVGTLEPRKNHKTVLDAFEILWENNIDVKLSIIGKVGWKVETIVDRIKNHDEYNKRLFFIEKASDSDLGYCYENSEALIFASIDEGFGLPIIEAASYKLPLILSNIPIFKEIAEENALYFQCENSNDLAKTIENYFKLKEEQSILRSDNIKINTWQDSFNDLMKIVEENEWYKVY